MKYNEHFTNAVYFLIWVNTWRLQEVQTCVTYLLMILDTGKVFVRKGLGNAQHV